MKFVHIADLHLDSRFTNLIRENSFGEMRRLDQREALKKVINYCSENNIEAVFIAGDLYEQKYIRQTSIEYINNLFKTIPNTKIFIVPGNHDPYLKNSFYNDFKWNENVKIFGGRIEKIELNNYNVYGFGFTDFYLERNDIKNIKIDEKEKINILLTHGSLNASDTLEKQYNPILEKELQESEFDYIALGHIHKPFFNEKEFQKIVYPGSLVSLGFDEPGEHGMIVGEINKSYCYTKFIKIDNKIFKEIYIDITELDSKEDIIENINNIEINENEFLKIILTGTRKFDINLNNLYKLINNKNIIRIKNSTKVKYDLEKIMAENTLRGNFVKQLVDRINREPENKELIEKAIEIGLEALENS